MRVPKCGSVKQHIVRIKGRCSKALGRTWSHAQNRCLPRLSRLFFNRRHKNAPDQAPFFPNFMEPEQAAPDSFFPEDFEDAFYA